MKREYRLKLKREGRIATVGQCTGLWRCMGKVAALYYWFFCRCYTTAFGLGRRAMDNNEALVAKWNSDNLIGCDVAVRMDNDSVIDSRTRSAAFVNPAGEAVIFVDFCAGYYLLNRVRVAIKSPVSTTN